MNSNLSDIGSTLTTSLATTGVSSMTGPIKLAAGTAAAPSLALASDATTGWYNNAAGSFTFVSSGAAVLALSSTGGALTGSLTISTSLQVGTTLIVGSTSTLQGVVTIAVGLGPIVLRNTTNNVATNVIATYQQGSGAGAAATVSAIGTGANDITTLVYNIGATEVFRYVATLFTHNTNVAHGAFFASFTEIAAPGAGAATIARLYAISDGANTRLAFVDSAALITTLYPVTTQAQQETATSNKALVSPGTQQYHPSAPKAWVQFQTNATIDASYNIASVVRNSAGNYTITFTTAFSSAAYAVVASVELIGLVATRVTKLAGSYRLSVQDTSSTPTDSAMGIVFLGDQ